MEQPLPIGEFEWVDPSKFDDLKKRLPHIGVDDEYGFVFEVDLHYPASIHDRHNDYPLAAETMKITHDLLSDYCRSFYTDRPYHADVKLVPNLRDKEKYVVHYRNLQLYTELGLEITKIHRILSFRQERWMANYIQLNTSKRKTAGSDFEKDFYKLANNACYGETLLKIILYLWYRILNGGLVMVVDQI